MILVQSSWIGLQQNNILPCQSQTSILGAAASVSGLDANGASWKGNWASGCVCSPSGHWLQWSWVPCPHAEQTCPSAQPCCWASRIVTGQHLPCQDSWDLLPQGFVTSCPAERVLKAGAARLEDARRRVAEEGSRGSGVGRWVSTAGRVGGREPLVVPLVEELGESRLGFCLGLIYGAGFACPK